MNMILTYVPESEHLAYDEALALAEERDARAASEFEASVPSSERFLGSDEVRWRSDSMGNIIMELL